MNGSPSEKRPRFFAWLAIAVYLTALGVAATLRSQGDFAIYRIAGARALKGVALYPPDDPNRFLYAPIFAIAFAPFAAIPAPAAQLAWSLVNAVALVGLIVGAPRMLFGASSRPGAALILVPAALCARFIDNNFEHGQINMVTLALVVWSITLALEGRPRRAGLMLAAAILTKPFALLGGWYLLLRGKWTVMAWTLAGVVMLLILPALFFGPRQTLDQTAGYVRAVSTMGGWYRTMLTNQSGSSAAIRLLSGGNSAGLSDRGASLLGMALEAVLLVLVSVWVLSARASRSELSGRLAMAAIFCVMPSFAPVSWKSYYVALLVPYAALISALWLDEPAIVSRTAWLLIALSVLPNIPLPGKTLGHLELFYSAHFISSLLVIGALIAASRGRACAEKSGDPVSG